MKITTTKVFRYFLAVLFFTSIFHSCRKSEKLNDRQESNELLRERLKNETYGNTQILNLKAKGFYGDLEGNPITTNKPISTLMAASCPEPGEDYPEQSIYSVLKEFTCSQGYRIEVKYDIILAYTPLLQNSSGTASFGRLRLKNSSETIIWPTGTPVPKFNVTSIENLGNAGTDPNGLTLTKYRITFRSDYIPEATLSASATMETYLLIYTDCVNYPTFVCPYSPQQTSSTSQANTQPCLRIDKVIWNPRSDEIPPFLAGANPIGNPCFPYDYVFPHKQEIKFKKSDGTWGDFNLYINGGSNPSEATSLINYWDIWYIDVPNSAGLVPGNVEVKYRNNNMGLSTQPCVSQPEGTWVYETWYIN